MTDKRPTLEETIEVLPNQVATATEDSDVLSYINHFLALTRELKPMEEISLMTPEQAKASLQILSARKSELERLITTAKTLKKMV